MLRLIRTLVVAAALGHALPANADVYQLVGTDTRDSIAYEVVDANGRSVAQGRTDAFGRFELNGASGTYKLKAQWGRAALPPVDLVIDGNRNLKMIKIK